MYLIIGMGKSGKAAAKLLQKEGKEVIGVDRSEVFLEGIPVLKETDPIDWKHVETVILSPGIPEVNGPLQQAIAHKKRIIGEVELAASRLQEKRWIGITGSNGKTTTTLLVEHVLCFSGRKAKALGNVGKALCDEVLTLQDEIIVAELSSYQLETLVTPVLDAALILNITPNHLDRYTSMQAYVEAKFLIKRALKKNAKLFLFEDVVKEWPQLVPEKYEVFKAQKNHDATNYLAAFLLCREFGVTKEEMELALTSFKKPPHRVEFVRQIQGISFYNDSKGTSLDATMKAVQSLDSKIILIAGGVHKGASYKVWGDAFKEKVRAIIAIGEAAPLIFEDLSSSFAIEICSDLENAVKRSHTLARKGEIVLLSPGCASFDMFKDYAHRGDEFKRVVWEISE